MTLIQTAGIGGEFTIVTADTRLVKTTYSDADGELKQVPGTTRVMSDKIEKAGFLTNYVVFGAGGKYDLFQYVKDEIYKRVEPTDDLEKCKMILEEITNEIEDEELKTYLESKGGLGVQLSGFYENGDTGLINYNSNLPMQELRSSKNDSKILVAMASPNTDLGNMNLLSKYIQGISETVNDYLKVLFAMQSVVSLLYDKEVSSDINYYIIYNDNGMIYQKEGNWDTAYLYPRIDELKSEIEKDLGLN